MPSDRAVAEECLQRAARTGLPAAFRKARLLIALDRPNPKLGQSFALLRPYSRATLLRNFRLALVRAVESLQPRMPIYPIRCSPATNVPASPVGSEFVTHNCAVRIRRFVGRSS